VLDGVPQTDPFGGWVNWPAFDSGSIEAIRVVRGGGSVANGPGALAGTISMTSRSDAGLSGSLEAGSRDYLDGEARAGFALGGGIASLSAQASRSDGFVPITNATRGTADRPAPFAARNAKARWVAPLGHATELQANLSAFHDYRTRGTDFSANRTSGGNGSLRLVGRGPWQWSALGYWQWRNFKSQFASVAPGRATARPAAEQYSVPSHGLGGKLELRPPLGDALDLRIGLDGRRTSGETREYYLFSGDTPGRQRFAGGKSWTLGAFAESSMELGRVVVTGGARIDRWHIGGGHLFEREIASGRVLTDVADPPRQGWLPTARAGLSVPLSGGVKLRSAAYLGWRLPTLNELFRPFRAGSDATAANGDLRPEKLAGAEIGGDYSRGPFALSLTGFVNRLHDAIANVSLGKGPGVFPGVGFVGAGGIYYQRQNIDAVSVRGMEAAMQWRDGPWSLSAGASLTRARVHASGAALPLNGLRPAETPALSGTLTAGWSEDGKTVELSLRRLGGQFDDDLNLTPLKSATTLDAFASWPVAKRLEIVARGENLTNALVMAGINGDGSIERATPRTLWIGLRLGVPR
jgi:outer membrane receptor protein involved in Fe transport